MPELPEVQTVVNDLLGLGLTGQTIQKAQVFWRPSANGLSSTLLGKQLIGRAIEKIFRRGKYIVFHLSDQQLFAVHLRMSGRIRYVPLQAPREKHEHIMISLKNHRDIRFYDPRKFGRLFVGKEAIDKLSHLGVEPLEDTFTVPVMHKLLASRKRRLKPLLLDQSVVAGLGNIYIDEALWQAGLHPQRLSCSLTRQEVRSLFKAIRAVLRKGIRNFGTSLGKGEGNFISTNKQRGRNRLHLKAYGRDNKACARCGSVIERITVAQRSTYICTHCQLYPARH